MMNWFAWMSIDFRMSQFWFAAFGYRFDPAASSFGFWRISGHASRMYRLRSCHLSVHSLAFRVSSMLAVSDTSSRAWKFGSVSAAVISAWKVSAQGVSYRALNAVKSVMFSR